MIPIARPQMGEEEKQAVWEAMASGSLAQGPRVRELEEQFAAFIGAGHAVAASSGTTALHLALLAYGIGPGDEVITVPFTFIASANSVLYTGARPVFVDVAERDFNIDPSLIEAAITERTKAIMPVSLYGQPADMEAVTEIAERHGLAVVEDACQAHGAAIGERRSGTWGAGTFSFYPTKNMTTGEGGMITTDDGELAERARLLREHGMKVRYHHDVVGYNFRMTDIAAAIGLAQLPKLPANNERRRAIAARYDAELRGVITPLVRPGVTHVYHQYTLRVNERDAFAEALKASGVGSAVYYPIPVHRQKPYLALGYGREAVPVTDLLTSQVLSIPVHPSLTDDEVTLGHRGRQCRGCAARPAGGRGRSMSERPLRAGVVGLGMMGRNHVRVWDESVEGVELVARRRPRPGRGRRAQPPVAAPGATRIPERMFAEEELDLVSIVAPTSLHLAGDARGARRRRQRPCREADRLHPRRGERHDRGGGRRGAHADRRPYRALQPGDPRAAPAAGRGRAGPHLPDQRHPARTRSPRASATSAWWSISPRTTSTSCATWSDRSRSASTPRPSAASIPSTRTCSTAS